MISATFLWEPASVAIASSLVSVYFLSRDIMSCLLGTSSLFTRSKILVLNKLPCFDIFVRHQDFSNLSVV